MRFRKTILATITCGFLGVAAVSSQETDARIDALVRKLGSPAFVEREKARRDLESTGIAALPALKRAGKPADVETQCRIAELIRRAEEQILTQQILAPKEVHLKLSGATVHEGVAELAKLSGYSVQFEGNPIPLADKKITLDTGKTSFWQAVDRFCEHAGLVEKIGATVSRPEPIQNFGFRGKGRIMPMPYEAPVASAILLTNGPAKLATSYAGAIKSQLRVSRDANAKELVLQFYVSIEPRLLNGTLMGRPIVDRVIDQERRKLVEAVTTPVPNVAPMEVPNVNGIRFAIDNELSDQPGPGPQRIVQVRIKDGEHSTKQIRELMGKLAVQVDLTNETIARLDKVLDGAGRSADGANGGSLKVNGVRKLENGDVEVQISMVNLTPNPFGNNIVINGGGNVIIRGNINFQGGIVIGRNGVQVGGQSARPDLVDAKGQKFQVVNVNTEGTTINNGTIATSATILYRPNPGQSAASELVLFGIRSHTIAVPFRFENVPLP